ncbi:MAG: hypothetical protein CVU43_23415, partial [Chloroflexi bacterium HGW-Chloroflexi-5]
MKKIKMPPAVTIDELNKMDVLIKEKTIRIKNGGVMKKFLLIVIALFYSQFVFSIPFAKADTCDPPVRVTGSYFYTVQTAYNSAGDGNTVQITHGLFYEDILLNRNISTILKGGYNCQYDAITGYGTVNGSVTISNGSVTIANLIIKAIPAFSGYYNNGTKDIPCFWTGTTRTDLEGDIGATHSAYAYSPTVSSGGTIYTAGSYYDGTKYIPCYWAGTTRIDLAGDGTHNAEAFSITVSGGTVYTSGYYNNGTKDIPCYWTGTTRTSLAGDITNNAYAFSIAVYNGTVYTAGFYSNNGATIIPCFWTGTTRTSLAGEIINNAYASSIAVYNGTVYTAGSYFDGTKNIPCYWTGTTRTSLAGDITNNA